MGRKKHYHIPRQPKRQVDLDSALETSGTQSNEAYDGRKGDIYKKTEHVPPPFKGEGEEGAEYLKKSELSLTWKVTAIITAIFFSVGIPVIWFASGLSKDVDNLSEEVSDIKDKTDKLIEGSIRSEERLNSAEKSIDIIVKSLQRRQQKSPNKAN